MAFRGIRRALGRIAPIAGLAAIPFTGGASAAGILPKVLGAAGALGSAGMIGGGTKAGQPQTNLSGYAALPPAAQGLYNNLFQQMAGIGDLSQTEGRFGQALNPAQSPYSSQALYEYQQANPTKNVRPMGVLEPFNQAQQKALSAYQNPDYSLDGGLAQYFKPYHEYVIQPMVDELNQNYLRAQNTNASQMNARNPLGLRSSAAYVQNSLYDKARLDAIAKARGQGFLSSIDLRNDSLRDMLSAGNLQQKQAQAELQSALPSSFSAYNPKYQQALSLGQLYGAALPESQIGKGATPDRLTSAGKAFNFANALYGNQFTGLFG